MALRPDRVSSVNPYALAITRAGHRAGFFVPANGFHYIAQDLDNPAGTDWPLFARWLEAWDTSSRPDGPCMSGQALTTPRPGQDGLTPTGRVTHQ